MKKAVALIAFGIVLLAPVRCLARTLTIAVIDTGIDSNNPKLCKFGHKSFTGDNKPLVDNNGHGTHIAGIIAANAGDLDYCIVSLKFFSAKQSGKQNLAATVAAVNFAINIKIDYINYSAGGPEVDKAELKAVERALNKGIKIFAAAGNEGDNLDLKCNYYPACYDKRIVMVGNMVHGIPAWARSLAYVKYVDLSRFKDDDHPAESSNFGARVNQWELGTDVDSTMPGGFRGKMSGTSQATAIATGKAINERLSK